MNELIPAWLGVLYGVVVTVLAGGPIAAVLLGWFLRRFREVEKLSDKHQVTLFGEAGTNGLKGRVEQLAERTHNIPTVQSMFRAIIEALDRRGKL